ncbi:MAG: acyl-CoA thioesterase [Betaproteobacteria bacterium]|nr:acyl-CoA thioesterase [Betaproteobacteria bacterium]MDH4326175.1 acyl-CoA thioesterase [Betaproteobacteria bacterium]MDH5579491.1 acyl-CoA thioesterase [Betaproteobacteria bacterium]
MARTFTTERKIRFSHCDPAGIVYFVNFFDMVNGVVEDWFGEAIGFTFNEMHIQRRVGFPIVNTGCEFFRPCHLGDLLVLELSIARLGRTSIEFGVVGRVAGDEKFRARHKVVLMSLESQRALPIPDDLREKMQPFVV